MLVRELFLNEKDHYNEVVNHIVQSWQWGDAKEATNKKVFRYGQFNNTNFNQGFQITFHPLPSPLTNWNIGYIPKGVLPDEEMVQSLYLFGQKHNCIFIKIEPDVYGPVNDTNTQEYLKTTRQSLLQNQKVKIVEGKELFTKYNFLLNLNQTEEELLNNMHPKTRYNIKLAEKKGVDVQLRTDDEAFQIYLKLYFETVKRQQYYGHDIAYHQTIWQYLRQADMARIMIAFYENTPTTAWMLLNFHDKLYYPYGGSTTKHRNVMSSNLLAWKAIQLGKQMGLSIFDLWGAMGPNPDTSNPRYGFHSFKSGYGPTHVEYLGTFDLVVNPLMYSIYLKLIPWRERALKLKAILR